MTRQFTVFAFMVVLGSGVLRLRGAQPASTLSRIRAHHELACGVVEEDAEYSMEDDHGSRRPFDEELCRALATGVDAKASVKVTRYLDEQSAVDALRRRRIDVIATLSSDSHHGRPPGVRFSPPVFQDSLGLLVPLATHVEQGAELAGQKICVLAETGTEDALRSWFAARRLDLLAFPFQEEGEMEAAYVSHQCAALAAERSRLSLIELSLGDGAAQYTVLPESLSEDPMSLATRADDPQWTRAAAAILQLLFRAEALGITSENVDSFAAQAKLRADTLGVHLYSSLNLGLRPGWETDVLHATGNYGQIFDRTLGSGSERKLERLSVH